MGAFGAVKPRSERTGGTVMKKVSDPQVVTAAEAAEMPIPAQIQAALGELVGAARDGCSR